MLRAALLVIPRLRSRIDGDRLPLVPTNAFPNATLMVVLVADQNEVKDCKVQDYVTTSFI